MARTPGLDGLLARNRKAAQVLDETATSSDDAAPPSAALRVGMAPSTNGDPSRPDSQPASRPTQPGGVPDPTVVAPSGTPNAALGRRAEALSAAADRKQLNTYVRKAVIREARRRAEDDGTTISEVVDCLLEGWLAGQFRLQ